MKERFYENYPLWIVAVANAFSLAVYAIGAWIISRFGIVWLLLYLLYVIALEAQHLKESCAYCYYYGKRCAFGKGAVASLFFSKGDSKKFCARKITWRDILPDFLPLLVSLVAGVFLLVTRFDWLTLGAVLALLLLSSYGNFLVRGSLACLHCKQRQLGCPAAEFFGNKMKKKRV